MRTRSMPMCFNDAYNYFDEDWSVSLNTENSYLLNTTGKKVLGKMRERYADSAHKNMIIFDTEEKWKGVEDIANKELSHGVDYIVFPDSEDRASKLFYQ